MHLSRQPPCLFLFIEIKKERILLNDWPIESQSSAETYIGVSMATIPGGKNVHSVLDVRNKGDSFPDGFCSMGWRAGLDTSGSDSDSTP